MITLAFGVTAVKVSSYQTLSRKGRDALVYPRLRSAAHVGLIRGDVLERFETERRLLSQVVRIQGALPVLWLGFGACGAVLSMLSPLLQYSTWY